MHFFAYFPIGLSIYILYGIWNSNERIDKKQNNRLSKYETKDNSVAIDR